MGWTHFQEATYTFRFFSSLPGLFCTCCSSCSEVFIRLESRKAAIPKYFLPFSVTELQLQFVHAPPPARRSAGKANLTHLVIPKWYSVGYIEYFHLSNCFLSLGVIKLKADKGKGLHKGACGLEGDSSHLESPWTRRGWQALIQPLRPSSSQKVLCTKAGHVCSCQVFRWFSYQNSVIFFKWILKVNHFFKWFLKMLALNTKCFNHTVWTKENGPKSQRSLPVFEITLDSPRAPLLLSKFSQQTGPPTDGLRKSLISKQWGLLTNLERKKQDAIKSGIHVFETKTVSYSVLVLLELKFSRHQSLILDIFVVQWI